MDAIILESCHSTWIFDPPRLRFRRILKDIEIGRRPVTTAWRSYARIDLAPDGEAFTVVLNPQGSRLIRSWRHTDGCVQCGAHRTTGLSLTEIRQAIEG
jgi:hypothetical protein